MDKKRLQRPSHPLTCLTWTDQPDFYYLVAGQTLACLDSLHQQNPVAEVYKYSSPANIDPYCLDTAV